MAHTPSRRFRTDTAHVDPSAGDNDTSTGMRTRQPENLIRTLKMPLPQTDVDEQQLLSAKVGRRKKSTSVPLASKQQQASHRAAPKPQTRPATVVEQLKHCLAQYELLQKQMLCAELMGTASQDHDKSERVAQKLIRRITSLRKQVAAKAKSVQAMMPSGPATSRTCLPAGNSDAIDTSKPTAASTSRSAHPKRTIKLSVSHPTALVLIAFADAGKRPSALVERALWADRDVQDAALLLNLNPPTR